MQYENEFLKTILKNVKTIAILGASSSKNKDSYKVMQFLINYGYDVFPVNPNEKDKYILGRKCYENLASIKEKIDMVDVFRGNKYLIDATKEAIEIKSKVLWFQEGLIYFEACKLANESGLKVIMDECPKKVLEN